MKLFTLKSTSALALALVAGGVMATATPVSAENSEGKVKYKAGQLTTTTVPNFDFGERDIVDIDKTYQAESAGKLTVSDLTGTSKGWTVSVKQLEQLKAGSDELTGAELKLDSQDVSNSSNETVTPQAVTLRPGVVSPDIFSAAAGNGNGTSILNFKPNTDEATLTVPGDTAKKAAVDYKATLEWTLAAKP